MNDLNAYEDTSYWKREPFKTWRRQECIAYFYWGTTITTAVLFMFFLILGRQG